MNEETIGLRASSRKPFGLSEPEPRSLPGGINAVDGVGAFDVKPKPESETDEAFCHAWDKDCRNDTEAEDHLGVWSWGMGGLLSIFGLFWNA